MVSLFGYLMIFLAWILWMVRVAVCFCYSVGIELGIEPLHEIYEIVILFVTLFLLVLASKRNIFGALFLFSINAFFFGKEIMELLPLLNEQASISNYIQLFICICEIIIPLCIFLSILNGKDRKVEEKIDKKTDWFFNNKNYNRIHDERADENQYKF